MLKSISTKGKLVAITLVACCVCMISCDSNPTGEPTPESLVTLKVVVPQDEIYDIDSPKSRSGTNVPGEPDESKITSLKFFVFNADNSDVLEVYKGITIDGNGNSTDPMWDPVNKTLRITVTPGSKKIYCLANWTDGGSGMSQIADNITTISQLTSRTRTHTNFTLANPPVMTGYLAQNIMGNETGLSIQLTRQIARVELFFKLSDVLKTLDTSDIKITGVKFLQLPSASFVFPQSPVASPSGLTVWGQSAVAGATSASLTGTAVKYKTMFYIPEYYPTGQANATVMVIRATYNGTTSYYNVTIDPSASASYTHAPYAIERNHTYQYTVAIEGIGVAAEPTRSPGTGQANVTYKLEIK